MAEAEDVLTDLARHATIYARSLWLRNRGDTGAPPPVSLAEVVERLELLAHAALGSTHRLRSAQAGTPATLLARLFRRHDIQPRSTPVPATDGCNIWLPAHVHTSELKVALDRYRAMMLSQARRAQRGSAHALPDHACATTRAVYLILEAQAVERDLIKAFPGLEGCLTRLRQWCLQSRPKTDSLPPPCRPLEQWLQALLAAPITALESPFGEVVIPVTAAESAQAAHDIAQRLLANYPPTKRPVKHALHLDAWTGELFLASREWETGTAEEESDDALQPDTARSARMPRRPKEREASPDEDDEEAGVWMVQTNDPLEKAEDPYGLQRPADKDEDTAADEYADALSELPEARLVASSTPAKEILVSDDPPDKRQVRQIDVETETPRLNYPEWDYRRQSYRHPGAIVHLLSPISGSRQWVDQTLAQHRGLLDAIRKRFEVLRAEKIWLRRRLDGDEIDLDAYTEGLADYRAGRPMPQALYRQQSRQDRDLAIMLLIDISGSTDSWLIGDQRIIDIERESLLLVSIALEHIGEAYSIQAYSGEGPKKVTMVSVKSFDERYGNDVALRIAGLEPQYYTRSGAALRHATTVLMRQPARHRLLLLLSDGKPNDVDEYEGRYGVEDMRMAVIEAKAQGIFPFCLTIDRHAANYLPAVFGARQYALINKPEALPTVLLDWMRKLMSS